MLSKNIFLCFALLVSITISSRVYLKKNLGKKHFRDIDDGKNVRIDLHVYNENGDDVDDQFENALLGSLIGSDILGKLDDDHHDHGNHHGHHKDNHDNEDNKPIEVSDDKKDSPQAPEIDNEDTANTAANN